MNGEGKKLKDLDRWFIFTAADSIMNWQNEVDPEIYRSPYSNLACWFGNSYLTANMLMQPASNVTHLLSSLYREFLDVVNLPHLKILYQGLRSILSGVTLT